MERVGGAFRWRPEHPCSAEDLFRVESGPEGLLVVMASAGEDGFSTCWAPGSRLVLDLFMEAWRTTSGAPASRLEASVSSVRERYLERARDLQRYVPEDDLGGPHAGLTALAIVGGEAAVTWIGGDFVLGTAEFVPSWVTAPHDLQAHFEAEGHVVPEDAELPSVVTRVIAEGIDGTPSAVTHSVRVGQSIIVADSHVHRKIGADGIAYIASVSLSPQEAAEDLVRLAYEGGTVPYAAACVIRLEDVDLPASINSLIDSYKYDGNDAAALERAARAHRILPLVYDMGGALGFTPDGRAVSLGWDELDASPQPWRHVGATLHARDRLVALDPSLKCAAPPRGDAPSCERCAEWKTIADGAEPNPGCPFCSYLGWTPPSVPLGLARELYLESRTEDAPVGDPPTKRWWQFWKRGTPARATSTGEGD